MEETKLKKQPEKVISKSHKKYYMLKRTIDVICALTGLVLLFPILIVIGLIIKIEDKKGNIIFKQQRVGKDGFSFEMYKFRSMVSNAEELLVDLKSHNEATGPLFKMENDPRITRIGKFIRKTSLDELPQLINVLKGEMSLVGPRPALPSEVEQYTDYERNRLSATPGLTCYWQVNGRSKLTFQQQVDLDIRYINEKSIMTDIKLIAKTLKVLFGTDNAY
nr:sugar transferase [Terribacillus saccharophilus]